eukprot:5046616-Pyramimonas_sp.AAC.1
MHAGGCRGYGPGAFHGGSRCSCVPVLAPKGRHSPIPRARSVFTPPRARHPPSTPRARSAFAASLGPCGELQRLRARDIPRVLK